MSEISPVGGLAGPTLNMIAAIHKAGAWAWGLLPYSYWTHPTGAVFVFDRNLDVICCKRPDGQVIGLEGDVWIKYYKGADRGEAKLYGADNPPETDRMARLKVVSTVERLGIAGLLAERISKQSKRREAARSVERDDDGQF